MYDWILEADVYRYRKALDVVFDPAERSKIIVHLKSAEAGLSSARSSAAQISADRVEVQSAGRFAGKGLWGRARL